MDIRVGSSATCLMLLLSRRSAADEIQQAFSVDVNGIPSCRSL